MKYRRPPQELAEESKFFVKHWWNQFIDWADKNKDHLMTGALVLAIVILGIVLWNRYAATKEVDAWAQVSEPAEISDLETAAVRLSGSRAEPFLRLRLADDYVSNGQADKALPIYTQIASTKTIFAARAEYSLAFAQESLGHFDDAKKALETLAARTGFWADEAKDALKTQDQRAASFGDYEAAGILAAAPAPAAPTLASTEAALAPATSESRQAAELEAASAAASTASELAPVVPNENTTAPAAAPPAGSVQ
jgi:predicted negative regulator of RcsB-dependent stress response